MSGARRDSRTSTFPLASAANSQTELQQMQAVQPADVAKGAPRRAEAVALALVLVAAFHALPGWIVGFVPAMWMFVHLSAAGFSNLWDAVSVGMPLVLCLATPVRSGLRIGVWRGHAWAVLGICALPVVATAVIYPLTSQPFTHDRVGGWLISPAAQELLFTGYLYGLLDRAFSGSIGRRIHVRYAVPLTAVFFMLWHVANFAGIQPSYVVFQLTYTFIGGAWLLLVRQLTGSLMPGIVTHMAVNFLAWAGW